MLVDLGGVWLRDGSFAVRERWAAEHGLTGDEFFGAYLDAIGPGWEGGRTEVEIRRRLAVACRIDADEVDGALAALHAHETLDPALTEYLQALRPARRVGVITNAGPSARAELWGKFPFGQLTDAFVVSAEEGMSKPDPRIFRIGAERLGVRPERCLFVDDKVRNVEGARAVGMRAVHHTDTAGTIARLDAMLRP